MSTSIIEIGMEMVAADLPPAFVLRVLELARESPGVEDLVHLWSEAPDRDERAELEAELHAAIEDREGPAASILVESTRDADRLLDERRALKAHLRALVDAHGGVSAVARRAEMPQPSLSRLLNSMSEPRASTLSRLAEAMGLPVDALRPGTAVGGSRERRIVAVASYENRRLGILEEIRYGLGARLQEAR